MSWLPVPRHAGMLAAVALAAWSASCVDPTRDSGVDALGDEAPGIRPGPLHRAGQPCLQCHGGDGPGEPDFSIGGTIYATRTGDAPLAGADVTIIDAKGTRKVARTNEVGNFYFTKAEWEPSFPLFVRIDANGQRKLMQTRIGQNGGCAFCHRGPRPKGNPAYMPPVFLEDR